MHEGNLKPAPSAHEWTESELAIAAHTVPFVAWIFLIAFLGDPAAWKYALRTAVGLALFLALRPWRWYAPLKASSLPLAIGAGVAVFVIWVAPECWPVRKYLPGFHAFYMQYFGHLPFIEASRPPAQWPYAPEVCGWPLALVRLGGSAFVIAFIEEFCWRSFIYRWMLGRRFLEVDIGVFNPAMWLLVNIFFGLEHAEWLAGILAGLAYGWVMIRTRDIWAACLAHVITNFLLGVYVLATGEYNFW